MTRSSKSRKPLVFRPFTPLKRLFLKLALFNSAKRALGKRHRTRLHEYSDPDPVVDTPPEPKAHAHRYTNAEAPRPHKPACIALQSEDSTGDIVVITALDSIPFCCHEDLLTMPHASLLEVARTLNAKLPKHINIDTSLTRSLVSIRNDIEAAVCLRPAAPPAPKPVRSCAGGLDNDEPANVIDLDAIFNRGPSTSPLAMRTRLRGTHVTEDREEGASAARPFKKRKVSLILEEPDMPPTPTPLPRTWRLREDSKNPELMSRAERTHRRRTAEVNIDTSFITTTRPNYGRTRAVPGTRYTSGYRQPTTPPLYMPGRLSEHSPSPCGVLRVGVKRGIEPAVLRNFKLDGHGVTDGEPLRATQIEKHEQMTSGLGDMNMSASHHEEMEMSE